MRYYAKYVEVHGFAQITELSVRWLLEYRSLTTRINTFSVGLPQFIHPVTERIQGHWWQMGARSGRFSCREPNLTNIPRDQAKPGTS